MRLALRSVYRTFFLFGAIFFSEQVVSAQLVQSSLKLTSVQQTQIHDLAARVLKHTDSVSCKKGCTILVANFTGETGSTSGVGIQLADEVSAQLAAQATGAIQVANRARLQQYLEKERIASKLLEDDNAARWLAMENGATVVLIGYLKVGLTRADLHVQLLDTRDFAKRNVRGNPYVDEEMFTDMTNFVETDSAEPFGEPVALKGSDAMPKWGQVSARPKCAHQPDPSYSDAARIAKFKGDIVLRVVISQDGSVSGSQILKGAPFGLNKQALDAVRMWRCEPAEMDGKPVAMMVPVEMSFRVY